MSAVATRRILGAMSHDHIFRRFLAATLLSVGAAAAFCGPAVGLAHADPGDPPPPPPPHPFCTPRGGLFMLTAGLTVPQRNDGQTENYCCTAQLVLN